MQAYFDDNGLPAEVDIYAISTRVNAATENYPPADWFAREGWTPPVILDDRSGSIDEVIAITPVPSWVVIGPDNRVVERRTGLVTIEDFEALVDLAAGL